MKTLSLSDSACAELLAALQGPVVAVPPVSAPPTPIPIPAGPLSLTLDWDNPQTVYSSGFGADSVLEVRFTTGALNPGRFSKVVMAEYRGGPSQRMGQLVGPDGAVLLGVAGTTLTFIFSVGANNSGYYPALLANTTYAIRVRNQFGLSGEMYAQLLK